MRRRTVRLKEMVCLWQPWLLWWRTARRAQSAARSKERKQRHIAELEHDKQLRDEELAVCLHQNAALQHDKRRTAPPPGRAGRAAARRARPAGRRRAPALLV